MGMAVPIPGTVWKPWSMSWYVFTAVSCRLMVPVMSFNITYTRPMTRKSLPPPLGIITNVCQEHALANEIYLNPFCTSATTLSQLETFRYFSHIASRSYWRRCSTRIPDVPTDPSSLSMIFCSNVTLCLGY